METPKQFKIQMRKDEKMNKYEFKATNLIAEVFEEHGVKFDVKNAHGFETIVAGFPIDGGPLITEEFISNTNDNDVAVRVFRIVTNTPEAKRTRAMEACNILNKEVRCLEFTIDDDGDVNASYDFLNSTPDEAVGEMALEIFVRTMKILDDRFCVLMKAIYTNEELNQEEKKRKLELLRRFQAALKEAEDRNDDGEANDEELDNFASWLADEVAS